MQIDLGKIKITWKGVYAANIQYEKDDAVFYNGSSYICVADKPVTGIAPVDGKNSATWQLMVAGTTPLIYKHVDTATRTFGNSWKDGTTTPAWDFRAGSRILLHLGVPMRNDSMSWGGGYTEVQYQIDGGTWVSLGHSGYDGVMANSAQAILTYNRTILIAPSQTNDFNIAIKLRHRSYDGTLIVNGSHELSGADFHTTLIAEEK